MTTKTNKMDAWLQELSRAGRTTFRNADLADALCHGSAPAATQIINAYQKTQIRGEEWTDYVIHRTGRGRTSVWHVGHRRSDLRSLGGQTRDDMRQRLMATVLPVVEEMRKRNTPNQSTRMRELSVTLCRTLADDMMELALQLEDLANG